MLTSEELIQSLHKDINNNNYTENINKGFVPSGNNFLAEPINTSADSNNQFLQDIQSTLNTYQPLYSQNQQFIGYQTPEGNNVQFGNPKASLELSLYNSLTGNNLPTGSFNYQNPKFLNSQQPYAYGPNGVVTNQNFNYPLGNSSLIGYKNPAGFISYQNPYSGYNFRSNVEARTRDFRTPSSGTSFGASFKGPNFNNYLPPLAAILSASYLDPGAGMIPIGV